MTEQRPVVLVVAGRYLPGFRAGGPIRSLQNVIEALGSEFEFRVIALDRDLGDSAPYPGVGGSWMRVGPAAVRYLSPRGRVRALWSILRAGGYNVLYLNTFFDPMFAAVPLLLRRLGLLPSAPAMIAVRGQFAEGAMQLRTGRKRVYLSFVRRFLLRGDEYWQATSDHEVQDIRTAIGSRDMRLRMVACVPPMRPSMPPRPKKVAGRLRAVFVSRVARNKNLLGAIRMLKRVHGELSLDVVGPIEDAAYWSECEHAATEAGAPLVVRALREVPHGEVTATFGRYDLFLFPTLGENFGHVVIEALLAGCPCLLSDRTPWRGLEAAGAGWDLPLEHPEAFTQALQWSVDADDAAFAPLSYGARAYAERYLMEDKSVEEMRGLLRTAMNGS